MADAAMKAELMAKGIAYSLYTTAAALVVAPLHTALGGIAVFVRGQRTQG